MAHSYQNEIPKARVNITLDIEMEGSCKKKELPLKILALADYTHKRSEDSVMERKRININKSNFDQVINKLTPELNISVPNTIKNDSSQLKLHLIFKKLTDFHPQQIVYQVKELKNLLSMRNLLKDLKANLLDNHEFRTELERIVKTDTELNLLQNELQKLAPINR